MKNTIAIIPANSLWDAKLLAHFSVFSLGSWKLYLFLDTVDIFAILLSKKKNPKQTKLLFEKLEINPSREYLFQKWVFCFPLHLMMQHSSHFRGMQLLFSILAYIHVLSILRYSVAFLLQLFRNNGNWRVM